MQAPEERQPYGRSAHPRTKQVEAGDFPEVTRVGAWSTTQPIVRIVKERTNQFARRRTHDLGLEDQCKHMVGVIDNMCKGEERTSAQYFDMSVDGWQRLLQYGIDKMLSSSARHQYFGFKSLVPSAMQQRRGFGEEIHHGSRSHHAF